MPAICTQHLEVALSPQHLRDAFSSASRDRPLLSIISGMHSPPCRLRSSDIYIYNKYYKQVPLSPSWRDLGGSGPSSITRSNLSGINQNIELARAILRTPALVVAVQVDNKQQVNRDAWDAGERLTTGGEGGVERRRRWFACQSGRWGCRLHWDVWNPIVGSMFLPRQATTAGQLPLWCYDALSF